MSSVSPVPLVAAAWRPAVCMLLVLLMAACQSTELSRAGADPEADPGVIGGPRDTAKPSLTVYLSFDDGPQHGTANCLRICQDNGVKATFFMVGLHQLEAGRPALVDSVRSNPLFLLANHSFTHAYGNHYQRYYGQPAAAMADFDSAERALKVPVKIARFPGNNVWALNGYFRTTRLTKPLAHLMDSNGYQILGWDLEWKFKHYDQPRQSVAEMLADVDEVLANKAEMQTPGHLVILAHDRMFARPADSLQLVQFLLALKQRPGLAWETLDRYPGVRPQAVLQAQP